MALLCLIGGLLVGLAPATTLAWSADCTNNKVCVSLDNNNTVPRAGQNGSNSNYQGDKYPNTNININDTVSSVFNVYTNRDVIFYHHANSSGNAFCVDSYSGYGYVGFWNNDRFSSHTVASDNSSC
jgi:hypothetical protein